MVLSKRNGFPLKGIVNYEYWAVPKNLFPGSAELIEEEQLVRRRRADALGYYVAPPADAPMQL